MNEALLSLPLFSPSWSKFLFAIVLSWLKLAKPFARAYVLSGEQVSRNCPSGESVWSNGRLTAFKITFFVSVGSVLLLTASAVFERQTK